MQFPAHTEEAGSAGELSSSVEPGGSRVMASEDRLVLLSKPKASGGSQVTAELLHVLLESTMLYAVRAIERVPAGSCHFPCLTDPSQLVVSFPCIRK